MHQATDLDIGLMLLRRRANVAAQNGVRTHFNESRETFVNQRVNGRFKTHRHAHIAPPVVGLEHFTGRHFSGDTRNKADVFGSDRLKVGKRCKHFAFQRLHAGAVEGICKRQTLEEAARFLDEGLQSIDLIGITRKSKVVGRIPACDFNTVLVGEKLHELLLRTLGSGHRAGAMHLALQSGTLIDNLSRIGQRQCSGSPSGRHFAHAVAGNGFGFDALLTKKNGETDLNGKEKRLSHFSLIERPSVCRLRHVGADGPAGKRAEGLVNLVNDFTEAKRISKKLRPHAGPLATVAGIDECSLSLARIGNMFDRGRKIVAKSPMLSKISQRSQYFFQRRCIDQKNVRKALALMSARTSRAIEERGILALKAVAINARQSLQAFHASGGNHERQNGPVGKLGLCIHNGRLFFKQDMRICAAEAERIHAGKHALAALRLRERFVLDRDANAQALEVDLGIGILQLNVGRDLAMFENIEHFGQTGHARTRFQMAEVALHGTDGKRCFARIVVTENFANALRFNRVARCGARTMGFDVGNTRAIDTLIFIDRFQQSLLRRTIRERNTARTSVGIDARRTNDGVNGVMIANGSLKRLDEDDRAAFRTDIAVSGLIEDLASTVRRQHVRLGKAHERQGREQNIDAAHQSHRKIFCLHGAAGLMKRDKTRRAGRIDGHARTVQIEEIRKAIGNDRERRAGHGIRTGHARIVGMNDAHVGRSCTDINGRLTACCFRRSNARIFKGLPSHFEHHALLRVKRLGFLGTHAEKGGVKLLDVAYNACTHGTGAPGGLAIRMPVPCQIKALARHGCHNILAAGQHIPQTFKRGYAARETATNANNRKTLFVNHSHSLLHIDTCSQAFHPALKDC